MPGAAGFDHPVLFADMSEGDYASLYLAAAVNSRLVLVRSDDDGGSYQAMERFSPERGNLHLGAAATPAPGVIALGYANLRGSGVGVPMRVGVVVSHDGGRTWSSPVSLGEGVFTGQPMMATDPESGRMYVVWVAVTDGGGQDVRLSVSADSGRSWSAPARINTSSAAAVVRMRPAVAVNRDGTVGVSWHDRRHDSRGKCSDIYFAASNDGGSTFREVRVTESTSCAEVSGNRIGGLDVAKRWPQGGDYSGIAASADGAFHVIWSDSRTGYYQAWTARVAVDR